MDKKYKIAYHLVGEQPIPVFMGGILIDAEQHILLSTEKTKPTAERVIAELQRNNKKASLGKPLRSAFDLHLLFEDYKVELAKNGGVSPLAFNVTGGTKTMFAAANTVFNLPEVAGAITPIYISTQDKKIFDLRGEIKSKTFIPFMEIENFIRLSGLSVERAGNLPFSGEISDRAELSGLIWKHREVVFSNTKEFIKDLDKIRKRKKIHPKYTELIDRIKENIRNIEPLFSEFSKMEGKYRGHSFAMYITGIWFEEYCLSMLRKVFEDNSIIEVRNGVSVSDNKLHTIQELDICYTDGLNLYLIECKYDTPIKQEHVHKLSNIIDSFGGVMGRGGIVASLKPDDTIFTRIKNNKHLSFFYGEAGIDALRQNIKLPPGKIFGEEHETK